MCVCACVVLFINIYSRGRFLHRLAPFLFKALHRVTSFIVSSLFTLLVLFSFFPILDLFRNAARGRQAVKANPD